MRVKDVYPLVVVEDPVAVRDWYARHLGFSAAFDTDWFVYLVSGGERPFALAFMRDGLDFQLPQFRTAMSGDALVITIEVEDVRAAHDEICATGARPEVSLRDEPWGQRHFMLRDPAGGWVDIVQQTDPDPAFLDQVADRQPGT
ncbi:VOC family protein [Actinomadura soli]|nr:VOC family protein [Actinomadura soli]